MTWIVDDIISAMALPTNILKRIQMSKRDENTQRPTEVICLLALEVVGSQCAQQTQSILVVGVVDP